MAITDTGMRAFRSAATLAGVLPWVRLSVGDGNRTVLTVSQTPPPPGERDDGLVVPPCTFRAAVAHAYHHHLHGDQFQLLDLEGDPTIEAHLPEGATLPGEIYRARVCGNQDLYLFVTGLGARACCEALAAATDTAEPDEILRRLDPTVALHGDLGFHGDPPVHLTAVHAVASARRTDTAQAVMARLLEICAAAEVIADLEPTQPPAGDGIR